MTSNSMWIEVWVLFLGRIFLSTFISKINWLKFPSKDLQKKYCFVSQHRRVYTKLCTYKETGNYNRHYFHFRMDHKSATIFSETSWRRLHLKTNLITNIILREMEGYSGGYYTTSILEQKNFFKKFFWKILMVWF